MPNKYALLGNQPVPDIEKYFPETETYYEVLTVNYKHGETIDQRRRVYLGTDRDEAIELTNRLDKRQDTWLYVHPPGWHPLARLEYEANYLIDFLGGIR